MPDSSRNNTTSLSTVSVRKYSTAAANIASEAVARNNYSKRIMSDEKLDQLRKLMLNHVKGWPLEEKLGILSEYGFQSDGKNVDELLVECLIIYMKEEDLENILKSLQTDQREIKNRYVKAESKAKQVRRTAFSVKNIDYLYARIKNRLGVFGKKYGVISQMYIKHINRGFKPDKVVRGNYGNLRKEINTILYEFYTNTALVGLGAAMGLSVEEMSKRKVLQDAIVEKVLLYVDLISGKNKNFNMAAAFPNPEPFNEVLQYTSVAYLTGKPGISISNLVELKKAARKAKEMRSVGREILKKRPKRLSKAAKGEFEKITGEGATKESLRAGEDNGILKNYKVEEIIELATKLGIKTKRLDKLNIGDLKYNIYKKLSDLRARISKEKDPARKEAFIDQLNSMTTLGEEETTGSGVPIVSFNTKGELSSVITKAVPVIVVGEHSPSVRERSLVGKDNDVGIIKSKEEIEKVSRLMNSIIENMEKIPTNKFEKSITLLERAKKEYADNNKKLGDRLFKSAKKNLTGLSEKLRELADKEATNVTNGGAEIPEEQSQKVSINNSGGARSIGSGMSQYQLGLQYASKYGKVENDDYVIKEGRKGYKDGKIFCIKDQDSNAEWAPTITQLKQWLSAGDNSDTTEKSDKRFISGDIGKGENRKKEKSSRLLKNSKISDYMSEEALTVLSKSNRGVVKSITPVYIVNKEIGTDMLGWTKKFLESLLGALKIVPITAPLGIGLEAGLKSAGLIDGAFANGGKVSQARKNKTSSFISGDSLNGKPNEERVDINWNKREYKVTPIPKFAKGGQETSNAKIKPLSDSEVSAPMSVGINSHLVSYSNRIQGDDGSGKALKVYMVNNALTEKVAVGANGNQTSLYDILATISVSLSNLESIIVSGNTQRDVTNKTLAAVGSVIGGIQSSVNKINTNSISSGFPTELDNILRGE